MMTTRTSTSALYAAVVTNWWILFRPKSLRARLAWLAALLLCLIQLVLSIAFYHFTSNWLHDELDQRLMTTAAQVAAGLNNGERLDPEDVRFRLDQGSPATAAFLRERRFFMRVLDRATGSVLGASASYNLPITPLVREGGVSFETLISDSADVSIRVYTLPLEGRNPLVLQTGESLEEVMEIQTQILRLLLLMLLATALLALGSGWFLATRALRPIEAITRTARDIGEHALSRRIDLKLPDDELGKLAQTFNKMLDRLESAFQRQRQFTADAAHELRTPLSIMQTGLDVVLAQDRKSEDYREALEGMHEEVERLSRLTGHLLTLARADTDTLAIEPRSMDLSFLLNTVTDQVEVSAEQKQITIERCIPPDVTLKGDEHRLIQLTLNLLGNAVKYTSPGGKITLKLIQENGHISFMVADTGVGIPPQHLAHVFERFYRVDRARNREQGGFGLGLAIAQHIAHLHGGKISVTSQLGLGSEFTVTLPVS